ncbi:hypothetical protein AAHE18_15G179000 [Arachis hypogaea]
MFLPRQLLMMLKASLLLPLMLGDQLVIATDIREQIFETFM